MDKLLKILRRNGMMEVAQLALLLDHVLEEPQHNTKEYLLDYSRRLRDTSPMF